MARPKLSPDEALRRKKERERKCKQRPEAKERNRLDQQRRRALKRQMRLLTKKIDVNLNLEAARIKHERKIALQRERRKRKRMQCVSDSQSQHSILNIERTLLDSESQPSTLNAKSLPFDSEFQISLSSSNQLVENFNPSTEKLRNEDQSTNCQNVSDDPVHLCISEQETGRRPSRRAAIVAAKKIFNTVRNLSIADNPTDHSVNPLPSPKSLNAPHPYSRSSKPKKNSLPPPEPSADINVDLEMECYEELLSPVQNEFLYDAQVQYNINMKNFRELVADNVKIIQTDANGVPIFVTSSLNRNKKRGNATVNSKPARNKPVNTNPTMVVPMRLIQAPIMIT